MENNLVYNDSECARYALTSLTPGTVAEPKCLFLHTVAFLFSSPILVLNKYFFGYLHQFVIGQKP